MFEDIAMKRSTKAIWKRYLLPALAFVLVILCYMYLSGSGNGSGATSTGNSLIPATERYDYPMYDVALAFGDSITQQGYEHDESGWLTHLSEKYVRRMDVLNRGFSGYNTTRARQVVHSVFPVHRDIAKKSRSTKGSSGMLQWLSRRTEDIQAAVSLRRRTRRRSKWPSTDASFPGFTPRVQLCILFFGANDAADPKDSRHTPLSEYSENLRYIVNLLQDPESPHYSPETRIVIVTPPAVGDKMSEEWFRGRGWTYGPQKNTVTKKYAEAAVKVAKEMHLPSVNLWSAIETRVQASRKNKLQALSANLETGNSTILTDSEESTVEKEDPSSEYDGYDEFLKDGLHLNSKGNKLLFRLLSMTIERTWPELRP